MLNNILGNILYNILQSRSISQRWLAEKVGSAESTISRYISGLSIPEVLLVINIAKVLNVSTDYLCGLTEIQFPNEPINNERSLLYGCYTRADDHDKKTIWTVLERYMNPDEKAMRLAMEADAEPRGKIG
jgi:transcriptional regulator with XRE-family HTH domain